MYIEEYSVDVNNSPSVARLSIRIDLAIHAAIGPGKVNLLELTGESGSISAAGRAMGLSYRRGWLGDLFACRS